MAVQAPLPFQLTIELTDLQIPGGVQSGATGQQGSKYLILAGRTNGLHGFNASGNFPPSQQNRRVFVVDTCSGKVSYRSLDDPRSGLNQAQIDTLSVVAPQSYQQGDTLYMTGGYGIDSASNTLSTKDTLSAINVSGLIHWVTHPNSSCKASEFIRQIHDPVFQVTGGAMFQFG
ncbi:MAG TPA: hypothetical protein VLG71_02535, partial [Candidatus Limnocylindria bacterium]|nr:hypothetical protein [Candidatus Limnocylindria bacterium]